MHQKCQEPISMEIFKTFFKFEIHFAYYSYQKLSKLMLQWNESHNEYQKGQDTSGSGYILNSI